MAILVWAKDREWAGHPVKAGDPLPEMTRSVRVDLYVSGEAIRWEAFVAANPPAPPSPAAPSEPSDPRDPPGKGG